MSSIPIHADLRWKRAGGCTRLRYSLSACVLLAVVFGTAVAARGLHAGTQQEQDQLTNPLPHPTTVIPPGANPVPDANDRIQMQEQNLKRASYEAANVERKRQLLSDSALIVKLAAELKAEIDQTPQNTLSLSIVRKADEIEHLAHNVQVKMKLTVGAD